jgi:putative peptidoglycan lipid II flippase
LIQTLAVCIGRWHTWTSVSVNRRIFAASLTIGALTFFAHIGTGVKDLVVAYRFGTTDVLDAFLIAFLLPSFFVNVIAGSLPSAFIPIYHDVQHRHGLAAAETLYAGIVGWFVVILLVMSVLIALLAPFVLPVLASGFDEPKLNLTRSLFFIVLPIIVFKGLTTVWTMKLNVNEQFGLASGIPILTPLITIVALTYGGDSLGIYALAGGTAWGAIVEAAIIGWHLHTLGTRLMPRCSWSMAECKHFLGQYLPMVFGALVMSSSGLVDQSMAAMLETGSVSALSYGNKVVSLIIGVGALALGAAILPYFSKMVASKDWTNITHTFRRCATLSLMITVPLTIMLIYFSKPLVSFIFERGAFSSIDMPLVAEVQSFYLVQIPFYVLCMPVVRLISSLQGNHLLLRGAVLSFFLNLILNFVFMRWLGVAGIALSTSLTYIVSFLFLYSQLQRQMKEVRCG